MFVKRASGLGVDQQGPPAPVAIRRADHSSGASKGPIPSRWSLCAGERSLLDECDFDGFCRAIRAVLEPRKEAGGAAFLRRGRDP